MLHYLNSKIYRILISWIVRITLLLGKMCIAIVSNRKGIQYMGLLIFISIVVFIIILNDHNKEKEKSRWYEDFHWCLGEKSRLENEYFQKKPYYFAYDEPPAINGDFYTEGQTKYLDSPYRKFTILYRKCIYENTASCVNCARRMQRTNYDEDLKQKYCYGSSRLCYHVGDVDNTDHD